MRKCNFHYVAMPMTKSKILNSVDFTKTQKSRYLKNETIFSLQIKKLINYTSRATLWQKNSFVAEVTFNIFCGKCKNIFMTCASRWETA